MQTSKFILGFGLSILLFACSQSRNDEMVSEDMDESMSNALISSSAAVENG